MLKDKHQMTSKDYTTIHYAKDTSLSAQKAVDELILAPSQTSHGSSSQAYVLNEVASRIWNLIDEQRSVADIRDTIVDQFDVNKETAEKDLVAFLQQLEQLGVIWPA
jgi:hypothetical protein